MICLRISWFILVRNCPKQWSMFSSCCLRFCSCYSPFTRLVHLSSHDSVVAVLWFAHIFVWTNQLVHAVANKITVFIVAVYCGSDTLGT